MARLLSLDYGTRRTGLAWTDPEQIIATGLDTVDTPQLEAYLKNLLPKESVEAFILGFPFRADGSDTDATQPVREFANALQTWFPDIELILVDESHSSQRALQSMIQAGVPKKKRSDKRLINQVAATLILQEFLEERS
ncbi:Holliday junction resolvase RuvX [bacterium]|nr:Holliday junction resolvase RuvX [bacterium]